MFHKIHDYLHRMTPERPPILREMEAFAAKSGFPIIGPLVGRLLYQLTSLSKAQRIMELGSGFGYSACWFAMAAGPQGHITLTDSDSANKRRALGYFKRARLQSSFDFRVGDAVDILHRLDGPFDIILNDIDKEGYPGTIDPVAERLRPGGLFITDNLIWSGKVCRKRPDKTSVAIIEFTRKLYADPRFFTTILPLRDGVAVAIRI
ncbi:MAG TPA: O-methyltransferase [Candidatus Deferrimicrobium sp.]|nr:O-methyltransferase [Candidatus Deferrimicrobium sp.]